MEDTEHEGFWLFCERCDRLMRGSKVLRLCWHCRDASHSAGFHPHVGGAGGE